jgi:hypothetical protein
MALLYNTSTGVTLASRGNSASEKLQGLEVLSLQDFLRCITSRVLGDGIVVPMEINFMDMEDKYYKYGTLRSLRYIYSNPFRFPISS